MKKADMTCIFIDAYSSDHIVAELNLLSYL